MNTLASLCSLLFKLKINSIGSLDQENRPVCAAVLLTLVPYLPQNSVPLPRDPTVTFTLEFKLSINKSHCHLNVLFFNSFSLLIYLIFVLPFTVMFLVGYPYLGISSIFKWVDTVQTNTWKN